MKRLPSGRILAGSPQDNFMLLQASFSLWPEPMPGVLSNCSLKDDSNLRDNYTDLTYHNAIGPKTAPNKGQGDVERGI